MQPNVNMPDVLALMQQYYTNLSMNSASMLGMTNSPVTPSTNGSAFNAVAKTVSLVSVIFDWCEQKFKFVISYLADFLLQNFLEVKLIFS